MKTKEQILKEVFGYTNLATELKAQVFKCMDIHASQAIDRCAEVASVKSIGTWEKGFEYQIDKQSILNVKNDLK